MSAAAGDVAGRLAVLVAFSGTLSEGTESALNGGAEVLTQFRRRGPALLIVCAKLETGFDEPRIAAMVIDRTLRGAHAVQVLGRANRVAPHKPPVRVLDFANSAADIAAAYATFLGASSSAILEHERRSHLGRELAHISQRLLEIIADRSVRAVADDAATRDQLESVAASVEEYVRSCEALGEEAVELPFGFATRLLGELRARESAAALARADAAAASTTPVGGGDGDGALEGGYRMRVGGLATTFSGRIDVGVTADV